MSIKVISAESHPLTALGIQSLLHRYNGITLVAAVGKDGELSKLASTHNAHVVITDQESACGAVGKAFRPMLRIILDDHPKMGVILHSCIRNPAYVSTLAQLGVHAILDKEDIIEFLPAAILAAHAKANYLSPTLANLTTFSAHAATDIRPLSRCEVNVLKSVLTGSSVKEISRTLYRSKQTISTHKKNAMRKLQVSSDAELFRAFSEQDFAIIDF
jgi:two-component system capsular synthesis response regulator RcsB